jgi:hypothetical protein
MPSPTADRRAADARAAGGALVDPHPCRGYRPDVERLVALGTSYRVLADPGGCAAGQPYITEPGPDDAIDVPACLANGLGREVSSGMFEPDIEQLAEGRSCPCQRTPLRRHDDLVEHSLRLSPPGADGAGGVALVARNGVTADVHPQLPRFASAPHLSSWHPPVCQ